MLESKHFNSVGLSVFLFCILSGITVEKFTNSPLFGVMGGFIGLYFLFAIKVVDQWQKVALLRFGRYRGLRGPGLFLIIPIIETLSRYVDQRVRVTTVSAESTLTRDTVPVSVDAIIFWLVWNAEKSILEVEDFIQAITLSSQTALRESIGRHHLAEMITERETLGRELQKILDEKTTSWGITVQSVEIRDVRIPQALENAMSQQAQAERERQARVILGEAEVQVSEQFAQASRVYKRQSRRSASARYEHALRSNPRKGCNGDCSFLRNRDDGPWWDARHCFHRQTVGDEGDHT